MKATISIRWAGWLLALAALAALAAITAGPAAAQTMTPVPAAAGDGAGCLPWLAAPLSTSGPLCGSCAGQCRSDGLCKGKAAGDLCDNSGATCQVVGGCGLHDCCKCSNALLAAVEPGAKGAGGWLATWLKGGGQLGSDLFVRPLVDEGEP